MPAEVNWQIALRSYVTELHGAFLPATGRTESAPTDLRVAVVAAAPAIHLVACTEDLPDSQASFADGEPPVEWTVQFYFPGDIDLGEGTGPQVLAALGVADPVYHLVIPAGTTLSAHHAQHAGIGLAGSMGLR